VHLALWVTVANACFAAAALRSRRWSGCVGGGAALGLALMSKGPVALVLTLFPFTAFLVARRLTRTGTRRGTSESRWTWTAPVLAGAAGTLAIALPWPVILILTRPSVVATWMKELKGEGAGSISHDPPYAYLSLLPNLVPWLPLFIAGVYLAMWPARRAKRLILALLLLAVPIVALSFHHDRKERYLLPLAGPAAILAAHAAVRLKRTLPTRLKMDRVVWVAHWMTLTALALGLPAAGHLVLRLHNGRPWYPLPLAAAGLVCFTVLIGISAFWLQTRWRSSFVLAGR
jgi:4-amino-4-deoxy-L-arabinose transferase-like glycosyltransferase